MDKNVLLKLIIDRIVYLVEPVEIFLFGSFAFEKQRVNSDIDLLVVMNVLHKRQQLVKEITYFISQLGYNSDIILISKNELVTELTMEKSFLFSALKKSLKVYEKSA
jgi:predicted nucleotidyltransferase